MKKEQQQEPLIFLVGIAACIQGFPKHRVSLCLSRQASVDEYTNVVWNQIMDGHASHNKCLKLSCCYKGARTRLGF